MKYLRVDSRDEQQFTAQWRVGARRRRRVNPICIYICVCTSIHLSISISMYIYIKYLCIGSRDKQQFTTKRGVCARRRVQRCQGKRRRIYLSIYRAMHLCA